jgi:hypothetical protein
MPAVLAGLQSAGAAVDVGLSTTPAMFYGIIAPGQNLQLYFQNQRCMLSEVGPAESVVGACSSSNRSSSNSSSSNSSSRRALF